MGEFKRRTTAQDDLLAGERRWGRPVRKRRRRPGPNPWVLLRFAGMVLAFFALVVLGLPLLVRADRLRPELERHLSELTGRHVELHALHYSLRHGALVGSDFVIAEDPSFGGVPFLQARSVEFNVSLWSAVFSREPRLSRVAFDSPTIVLKEDAHGKWNYSSLFTAASRTRWDAPPPILEVTGGRLGVETESGEILELHDLQLSIPRPQWQAASAFTLSGTLMSHGKLQVKGEAGPIDWDQGKPLLPLSALVDLKGFDLSEWMVGEAASGLGGLLSIDGSIESNGRTVDFNGQANSSKLKLARAGQSAGDPLDAVFTLHQDLDTHAGVLSQCDIRMTKGIASLLGKFDTAGNSVQLDLKLTLHGAPATQLGQFLPALGINLPPGAALEGGDVESALQIQGPVEHPGISGTMSVDDTRLNHFYLSQRLETVSGLDAGELDDSAEILSWKCTLVSAGNGVAVNNLVTDVSGLGELSGNGTIGLDGGLHFTMSGIRGLTGPKGTPIPFTITGTSHDPIFQPAGRK
jgi:hypothetical protein